MFIGANIRDNSDISKLLRELFSILTFRYPIYQGRVIWYPECHCVHPSLLPLLYKNIFTNNPAYHPQNYPTALPIIKHIIHRKSEHYT